MIATRYCCLFPQRLFTVEELALYNGTDEGLPILLGILGYSLSLSLSHSQPYLACIARNLTPITIYGCIIEHRSTKTHVHERVLISKRHIIQFYCLKNN